MLLTRALRLALGLSMFSLMIAPASAEHHHEPSLSGHVQSGMGRAPVVGARVELRELHRSAVTDQHGEYAFTDLAPGEYTLVVTAKDQAPVEQRVTVDSHGSEQDILVDTHAKALDEVDVMGRSVVDPVIDARQTQQQAPNLILVQSAAQIQQLPDVNAGEAVRRLPGISLETDTGEGRFVNIRGLDSDLNSTTFDGVQLLPTNPASSQGGARAVAFDAIPAGLIGTITVTNTNLPEQDAEALGGTIDIKPKQIPAGKDYFLDSELGYGDESLRSSKIKDFQLSGGVRFGLDNSGYKPFSFVGTVSYYDDKRGIDDVEAAYVDQQSQGVPDKAFAALDHRYYNYDRHRHGYGGELAFQPDNDNRWYARFFDTGYTEHKYNQSLVYNFYNDPTLLAADPGNPNGFIDSGVNFDRKLTDEEEKLDSRVATIGGENNLQSFKLDYHVAFTKGSYNQLYNYGADFSNPDPNNPNLPPYAVVQYDNSTDPRYPRTTVLSGLNPLDPSQYALHSLSNGTEHSHDQEWSGALNITVPTQFFAGDDENLKFGISARLRDRHVDVGSYSYDVPDLLLSNAITDQFITFYNNHYQNGYAINPAVIRAIAQGGTPVEDVLGDQGGYNADKEDVYAGYAQYQFKPVDKLDIVAGVRWEETNASYAANQELTDANGNVTVTPNTQHSNYSDFFPTVQARYEFAPDLIGRAVYSQTIARPGFNQITASVLADATLGTINIGNPQLKPIKSDNFDFDLEYYLPQGGIASAGLFRKDLSNYIVQTGSTEVNPTTGPLAGYNGIVTTTDWKNISSATATGLQLNYVQRFSMLPGWLGGFGVNTNYTYVDSRLQIRPGNYTPLPSTSRNTANFAITYDYGNLTLNLGSYYTSKNIFTVGGSSATDVWSQGRFSVDFGASYAINDDVSIFFSAKNLTDTPLKFTEGPGANRPIQREFYGQTYLTGVRFHL